MLLEWISPAGPSSAKCVISAQNQITSGGNLAYASAETKLATTSIEWRGPSQYYLVHGKAVKLSKWPMKETNT
jgi:hypothetical protein